MRNKPAYAVESVDHALHLAQLLQQEGPMRVTEAAQRLGVSPSTAHRLLAMLIYRDFAEQSEDRRYSAGRMLRPAQMAEVPLALLRSAATPHLRGLAGSVHESANLMILVRTEARCLMTAESDQDHRVGDRSGQVLRAERASAGRVLLATLPDAVVDEYYRDVCDVDLGRLHKELAFIRSRGYAINDQLTESGLTALAVVVRDPSGLPNAALSIAMPTVRFRPERLAMWVNALTVTAAHIERDLRLLAERLPVTPLTMTEVIAPPLAAASSA